MFLKNPFQTKKLAKSTLVNLLISSLFISSGIGGIMLFDGYCNLGMNPKKVTKVKIIKQNSPRLRQNGHIQKPLLISSKQKQPARANNILPSHIVSATQSRPISETELSMLARIIHAEAGGESLRGQVAVGAVLLNRIKSGRFPRTLAANIFRPGEFESVSNGYIWSNPTIISYQAAHLAMNGWDPTYGALYFFNPAKTRSKWIWSRPIIIVIGQHNFAS